MTTLEFYSSASDSENLPAFELATSSTLGTDRRRKALHVINGEFYSGAERVQDLLGLCLPEFGYEVGFACVKPVAFIDARRSQEVPVYDARMKNRLDLRTVNRLSHVVRQENYEILHAHTPRSAMIARLIALRTGLPMVFHVHSPTTRDSENRWQCFLNGIVERFSLLGVSKLIAVSGSLGEHMKKMGYPANKIAIVRNGVPCLAQVPPHEQPDRQWTLGTVALFRPRKGTEILLEATAILRKKGYDVRIRAVGGYVTDEYGNDLKQLAQKLGIAEFVYWAGFRSDVNAQLAKTDLFVLPSLYGEGLPMVVLESMAAGIPVVSTDVEGIPEAIRDGVDGLIAKAGDAQSLSTTIERVLVGECSWQALRENAIHRHAEHFSDRSMARGVAAVYDELLDVQTAKNVDRPLEAVTN